MKRYRTHILVMSIESLRVAWAHRLDRWWSAAPFLPRPSREHLAWRIATAYGTPAARPHPGDVAAYVAWRRRYRRAVA
jgi:hypothetical protein